MDHNGKDESAKPKAIHEEEEESFKRGKQLAKIVALCKKGYQGRALSSIEKYNLSVNELSPFGETALCGATFAGHIDLVEALVLEKQADVNFPEEDDTTALMFACQKGWIHIVHFLLDHGADARRARYDGTTALMLAVENGYAEVAERLTRGIICRRPPPPPPPARRAAAAAPEVKEPEPELGPGPETAAGPGRKGRRRLLVPRRKRSGGSGRGGHLVQFLSSRFRLPGGGGGGQAGGEGGEGGGGGPLRAEDLDRARHRAGGATALHLAVGGGWLEVAEHLLAKAGAAPDVRDARGLTPLHLACRRGLPSEAALLLRSGADIKARDNGGFTPLCHAVEKGHLSIIDLLFQHAKKTGRPPSLLFEGRPPPPPPPPSSWGAAAGGGDGAPPPPGGGGGQPVAGWNGNTPLHLAARAGRPALLARLLGGEPGAPALADARNFYGMTPAHLAVRSGNGAALAEVLRWARRPDALSAVAGSPLHLAAAAGRADLARALMDAGASLTVANRQGVTPAMVLAAAAAAAGEGRDEAAAGARRRRGRGGGGGGGGAAAAGRLGALLAAGGLGGEDLLAAYLRGCAEGRELTQQERYVRFQREEIAAAKKKKAGGFSFRSFRDLSFTKIEEENPTADEDVLSLDNIFFIPAEKILEFGRIPSFSVCQANGWHTNASEVFANGPVKVLYVSRSTVPGSRRDDPGRRHHQLLSGFLAQTASLGRPAAAGGGGGGGGDAPVPLWGGGGGRRGRAESTGSVGAAAAAAAARRRWPWVWVARACLFPPAAAAGGGGNGDGEGGGGGAGREVGSDPPFRECQIAHAALAFACCSDFLFLPPLVDLAAAGGEGHRGSGGGEGDSSSWGGEGSELEDASLNGSRSFTPQSIVSVIDEDNNETPRPIPKPRQYNRKGSRRDFLNRLNSEAAARLSEAGGVTAPSELGSEDLDASSVHTPPPRQRAAAAGGAEGAETRVWATDLGRLLGEAWPVAEFAGAVLQEGSTVHVAYQVGRAAVFEALPPSEGVGAFLGLAAAAARAWRLLVAGAGGAGTGAGTAAAAGDDDDDGEGAPGAGGLLGAEVPALGALEQQRLAEIWEVPEPTALLWSLTRSVQQQAEAREAGRRGGGGGGAGPAAGGGGGGGGSPRGAAEGRWRQPSLAGQTSSPRSGSKTRGVESSAGEDEVFRRARESVSLALRRTSGIVAAGQAAGRGGGRGGGGDPPGFWAPGTGDLALLAAAAAGGGGGGGGLAAVWAGLGRAGPGRRPEDKAAAFRQLLLLAEAWGLGARVEAESAAQAGGGGPSASTGKRPAGAPAAAELTLMRSTRLQSLRAQARGEGESSRKSRFAALGVSFLPGGGGGGGRGGGPAARQGRHPNWPGPKATFFQGQFCFEEPNENNILEL